MDGSMNINQFMQNYTEALKGRYGDDAEISFGEVTPAGVNGAQSATMEVTITVNGETQVIPVEVPELDAPAPGSTDILLNLDKAEKLVNKLDNLINEMVNGTEASKEKNAARLREVMNCIYQVLALLLECGNMSRQITRQTRNAELEMQIASYMHQAESIRSAANEAKGIAMASMLVSVGLMGLSLGAQGYGMWKTHQANQQFNLDGKTADLNLANLERTPADAKLMGREAMSKLTPKHGADVLKAFEGPQQQANKISAYNQASKELQAVEGKIKLNNELVAGMKAGGEQGSPAKVAAVKEQLAMQKDVKATHEGELKDLNTQLEKEAGTLKDQVNGLSDDSTKLNKLEAKLAKLENKGDSRNAAKIESLKSEISALKDSMRGKEAEINQTKSTIQELEGQIGALHETIGALDNKIELNEAFVQGAEMGAGPGAKAQIDALTKENAELSVQAKNLKEAIESNPINDDIRAEVRQSVNKAYSDFEGDVKAQLADGKISKGEAANMLRAAGLKKAELLGEVSNEQQIDADIGNAETAFKRELDRFSHDKGVMRADRFAAAAQTLSNPLQAINNFCQTLAQSKVQLSEALVKEDEAVIKQEEIQLNDSDQLFQNALKVFQAAIEALKELIHSMVELEKSISRAFA